MEDSHQDDSYQPLSDDSSITSQSQLRASSAARKKRVGKACDSCRLKKTKCSGKHPCEKCIADNRICIYTERKKSRDKTYSYDYVEMMEKRLCILRRAFLRLCTVVKDEDSQKLADFRSELLREEQASAESEIDTDGPFLINNIVEWLLSKQELDHYLNNEDEFFRRIEAAEKLALKVHRKTSPKTTKTRSRKRTKSQKRALKSPKMAKVESPEGIEAVPTVPTATSVPTAATVPAVQAMESTAPASASKPSLSVSTTSPATDISGIPETASSASTASDALSTDSLFSFNKQTLFGGLNRISESSPSSCMDINSINNMNLSMMMPRKEQDKTVMDLGLDLSPFGEPPEQSFNSFSTLLNNPPSFNYTQSSESPLDSFRMPPQQTVFSPPSSVGGDRPIQSPVLLNSPTVGMDRVKRSDSVSYADFFDSAVDSQPSGVCRLPKQRRSFSGRPQPFADAI